MHEDYSIFGFSHICGDKLLQCNHCLRIFCANCDIFARNMNPCCDKAIMEALKYYNQTRGDGFHRHTQIHLPKKKPSKKKVDIKDISSKNFDL